MRKFFVGIGAIVLVIAGSAAAFAANSGSLNASVTGAHTKGGKYGFKSALCAWGTNSGVPGYDGYVAGDFVVTDPDAHLNARVDSYGWAELKQVNSKKTVSYSSCLTGRSVMVHSSISIQVCKNRVLADKCQTKTVRRSD